LALGKNNKLYILTTYYERVTRGNRVDVIEIWDANTLEFVKEIKIPPKRVQGLNYHVLFQNLSNNFLLVQNATPAVSVSVVDINKEKFVEEITETAGCWGVIPLLQRKNTFGTICGDGSFLLIELNEKGVVNSIIRSERFFDPNNDPVFITPVLTKDEIIFVSYRGNIYNIEYKNEKIIIKDRWSILDEKDKEQKWAPGGYNLIDIDRDRNLLYILVHKDAAEGTHKYPGEEIWVVDMKNKSRVARVSANSSLSVKVSQSNKKLIALDGANLHIYDIKGITPKFLYTIKNAGEAALQVIVNE
jgi:aralkylamine dehydrogenase heavy chain/methylamine dehydrogenase heavy chain